MTEKINLSKNIWELTKSLQDTEPNTTLTQPGSLSNHTWLAVAELPVIMFLMWMLCTPLYAQTTNTIVSESLGSPRISRRKFLCIISFLHCSPAKQASVDVWGPKSHVYTWSQGRLREQNSWILDLWKNSNEPLSQRNINEFN